MPCTAITFWRISQVVGQGAAAKKETHFVIVKPGSVVKVGGAYEPILFSCPEFRVQLAVRLIAASEQIRVTQTALTPGSP